jgi:hypothetical protein
LNLARKSRRKRPIRKPIHTREKNIEIDIREIGCKDGPNLTGLKYDLIAEFCDHAYEPSAYIKAENFLTT